jgi:hypothetical protein
MECIFSNVFRGGDFLRILTVLSDLMVPLLIFYVVGLGLLMKQDVFGDFLNGAKDGMRTVIGIVPTLIGLMAADFWRILETCSELCWNRRESHLRWFRSVLCVCFPTARR